MARCKLYGFREKRVRPGLDDKVLTSWNGLMIHALARLGATSGNPRFVEAAARAAAFVKEKLRASDGGLLRRWREGEARFEGSLDDHVDWAFGLLGLFEATGDAACLADALHVVRAARDRFEDPAGGFFFAAPSPELITRMKEAADGALPSGNSMMALVCGRLGAITHDEALRDVGRKCVQSFSEELKSVPHGYPLMLAAWLELREAPRTLTLTAPEADDAFRAELARAHRAVLPGRVVIPVLDSQREALASPRRRGRRRRQAFGDPLRGRDLPGVLTRSDGSELSCSQARGLLACIERSRYGDQRRGLRRADARSTGSLGARPPRTAASGPRSRRGP